jgi:hypothetical protein
MRVLRRPHQPIPNKFADISGHSPRLELAGKPHYAPKRQNVVGYACEILLLGYGNHMKLDMLQFTRLID